LELGQVAGKPVPDMTARPPLIDILEGDTPEIVVVIFNETMLD
jgi:hypothetical protein